MNSGIYSIMNRVNGKRYVGSAINIKRRWEEHKNDLKKGIHKSKHFQSAWYKYGEENFVFEVLEFVQDKEELTRIEQYYLDWMGVCNRSYGYNTCKFAGNTLGYRHSEESKKKISGENHYMYGKHISEETKRKASISLTGRKHTEETKRKIREAQCGEKSYMYGKCVSDEVKEKISNSLKGRIGLRGENHPHFGKHFSEETKKKMSEAQSGEKHSAVKLTWEKVFEIRKKYRLINKNGEKLYSQGQLAKEYGVTRSMIQHIVVNIAWKEIE